MRFVAEVERQTLPVEVTKVGGRFRVTVGEEVWEVDSRSPAPGVCSLLMGGVSHVANVSEDRGFFLVDVDGESYRVRVEEETRYFIRTRGGVESDRGGQVLVAPMPGKVVHVAVSEGQPVKAGDGLVVIEAMKMENEFRASASGTVKEIKVRAGQTVNAGDILVVIG